MVFCGECGHNCGDAKFCPECGAKTSNFSGAPKAKAAAKPAPAKSTPEVRVATSSRSTPAASSGKVARSGGLSRNEDWEVYDTKMAKQASGNGIPGLKAALKDSECSFVFFHLHAKYDKAIVEIETIANVVLQWKGPNSSGMKKVKSNGGLQKALDKCPANKGYIEVLGKKNLSSANIFDRWRPGSGSKVIQD